MRNAMPHPDRADGDPGKVEDSARVGSRIRRLRSAANVSLSRLATESGLGKGTLSELENGKRNPTLDTLFAIATALDVPLSSLLLDDAATPRDADPATGTSVFAQLLMQYETPDERFELYDVRIATSIQISRPHRLGVRETFTVLDGEVSVGDTKAPHRVKSGESITYAGDVEHLYQAHGRPAVAVLLMSYPYASEASTS
jgi:transcriptional regulator with XRE-family HTH domain